MIAKAASGRHKESQRSRCVQVASTVVVVATVAVAVAVQDVADAHNVRL